MPWRYKLSPKACLKWSESYNYKSIVRLRDVTMSNISIRRWPIYRPWYITSWFPLNPSVSRWIWPVKVEWQILWVFKIRRNSSFWVAFFWRTAGAYYSITSFLYLINFSLRKVVLAIWRRQNSPNKSQR